IMSDKIWYAVEVEIARVGETAATTQLWAFNTTGVEISEDINNPDFITLRAYFNTAPDIEKIREQILRNLKLIDLPEFALRGISSLTVADQDWLAEWKKGYEPITIGRRLLICPSWKRDHVRNSERVVIEIDPGMAFGTGTHETTRGCLEMLEKYWHGGSLLDIGTGTGILAIAAVKLHPGSRVVGFDVDPEAVAVALENAAINGVADEIDIEVNKLSSFHGHEFDLVLANLTADVIIPLSQEFPQVLKSQGALIVSGILSEQTDDVRAALESHNLSVIEMKPDGEWMTMALLMQLAK
ncbi:MAG TPA: 50S ribosomal protein L11 methyltransferase, partial [Blastocatellia bacterium]|nr:50S ribosomal protein L11 methyltransferase [Blastocatellia bacterium]